MQLPGFTMGEFVAQPARREDIAELQAFAESNPEYWLLTHGHPPPSDEAAQNFEWHPPSDMGCSEHFWFVVRHGSTREILAEVTVATDLLAAGVYHLGYFMTATRIHGTGFAQCLYEAYERWAIDRGARWLRLGVVEANQRASAFWRHSGYVEVRRQDNYVMGDLSHVLITMVKPMRGETLREYLEAVPRDRNIPS